MVAIVGIGLAAGSLPAAVGETASQVLVDTVGARVPNGFWTVDPRMQPQIGQSFVLDRPVSATSIVLHPDSITLAKKPEYLVAGYRNEHFRTLVKKGSVDAVTVLNIWKSNTGAPLPVDPTPRRGSFDVAAGGFTNVFSREYSIPIDLSEPFTLPLEPAVALEPGVYLAAWYFRFPSAPVFGVRFKGEVSGRSGGLWKGDQWITSLCKYASIPDSSPAGTAAYVADQWAPPGGTAPSGPFPGTIGYLTWFRAGMDKGHPASGCVRPDFGGYNKKGVPIDKKGKPLKNPYDQSWFHAETGDLDMQMLGTALQPTP